MNKFKSLIESLQARYVIIIENNFAYVRNTEEIIGQFVQLDEDSKERLSSKLTLNGYQNIANELTKFALAFTDLEHNNDAAAALLPVEIRQYLKELGNENLLSTSLIASISDGLVADTNDQLKDIFLQNEVFETTQVEDAYNTIIGKLKAIQGIRLVYYKRLPTPNQYEEFRQDTIAGIEATNSQFYLAIVDKKLGENDGNEEGKIFVRDQLLGNINKQGDGLRMVGLILTSQQQDTVPVKYPDYFLREVSKSSKQLLDKITSHLAEAAYAEVFHTLNLTRQKSAQNAEDTVLVNQVNIKHIVQKSHEEGIPPVTAVKNWFENAASMHQSRLEAEQHKFIGSLTSFFDNDYPVNRPETDGITDELQAINTTEIFDYDINLKYEFPATGDIFYDGSSYYLLTGQSCELLLRSSNERQAHIAELLKAEFIPTTTTKKKLEIAQDNDQFLIQIQNFKNAEGHTGVLKIFVNFTVIAHFEALDTCAYNEDGTCQINTEDPISNEITAVLSKGKGDYYAELQKNTKTVIEVKEQLNTISGTLLSNLSFGLHAVNYNPATNIANFGLRRVCRVKGDFNKFITNAYNDYRGRVDLNQIHQTQKRTTTQNLKYGFPGQEMIEIQCNVHEEGQDVYVYRKDIQDISDEKFHGCLNQLPDKLLVNANASGQNYKLSKNSGVFELVVFYLIDGPNGLKPHERPRINGFQIQQGTPPPSTWNMYGFSSDQIDQVWQNEGKEQLVIHETIGQNEGIYVNGGKTRIFLDKGIIRLMSQEPEETATKVAEASVSEKKKEGHGK